MGRVLTKFCKLILAKVWLIKLFLGLSLFDKIMSKDSFRSTQS